MLNLTPNQCLLNAIIHGDIDDVRSLIQSGTSPNFIDAKGDSPLQYAYKLSILFGK